MKNILKKSFLIVGFLIVSSFFIILAINAFKIGVEAKEDTSIRVIEINTENKEIIEDLNETIENLKALIKTQEKIIEIKEEIIEGKEEIFQKYIDTMNEKEIIEKDLERGKLAQDLKGEVFTITAYSPYDNVSGIEADHQPWTTSTGTKPQPGTIAVDPDVIPYGSAILIIWDDGTFELGKAEDCGGIVKGKHIDVFRQTYQETLEIGKQKAIVIWYNDTIATR